MDSTVRVTRTEVADLAAADLHEMLDLLTRAEDLFREICYPSPTPDSLQADFDTTPAGFSRADKLAYRAFRGGRLAGYVDVLRGFAHSAQWFIGFAVVDPTMQSMGIGQAMVEAVAEDARAAGIAPTRRVDLPPLAG